MSTKTINSWDWDLRVRDRNLRNGTLTEKDVEKHLSALPDVADNAETVSLAQPALRGDGGGEGS
jgi:hypothetical protein